MATDSMMAKPTNRVLEMVPASSGCWEMAVMAWATALPAGDFDSYWLSDGVARAGRGVLLAALEGRGEPQVAAYALSLRFRRAIASGNGAEADARREREAVDADVLQLPAEAEADLEPVRAVGDRAAQVRVDRGAQPADNRSFIARLLDGGAPVQAARTTARGR